MLRAAPALTIAVMIGPVLAGLAGTLAPALGWLPALGGAAPGLGPLSDLFEWPGLSRAVRLSLVNGMAATALSLLIVVLVCAAWSGTRAFRLLERLLAPLLSVPHAAAAFGLAFLIAPSGWIARALSPWATGWERPADLLIVNDPAGFALVAGLVAKEVPFLLLMTIAALSQAAPGQTATVSAAMGYGRVSGWLKGVFPRVYAQIRLPVYAVLAYSMSVVDMAVILGPSTPSTLSVQVVRWMNDPDLALRFRAAAGASLQLVLVIVALGLWRLGEIAAAGAGRWWLRRGGRGTRDGLTRVLALVLGFVAAGAVIAGLAGLVVWSFAGLWRFPEVWPGQLSLATWARHGPALMAPAGETAMIALAATGLALVLVIATLEAEHRFGLKPGGRALMFLYLPLLVPQVAFLFGLQTLALVAGLDAGRGPVIAAHLVFVLPYVFLSLSDPWRAWDARYAVIGHALGAGGGRVLWRLRLPMLLRAVLTAAAVGLAASVGQYLPTLMIGAGRVETLTTEAVALASGGDRRVIAVFALAQTAAALIGFALALIVPRLVFARRRGMLDG